MQISHPKFGNIFNFCRIFAVPITELAVFCSVIWRSSVWELGAFLLGNLAKNHPYFIQIPPFCREKVK